MVIKFVSISVLLMVVVGCNQSALGQSVEHLYYARANQLYIGVEGGGMLNFSSFAGNHLVDQGFRKPPLPIKGGGISLRQNLTYKLALETGLSLVDFGYKSVYTSAYQGGKRWEAQTTSTDWIARFQVPVRLVWLLPAHNKPWRKFLSFGVNGFYNDSWDLRWNGGGTGTIGSNNAGDQFPFRVIRYPGARFTFGLGLGIGMERNLGQWGLLQTGAICNIGLQRLAVWDLKYTTWDISQAVDGITYNNRIVNKGSFLGLRMIMLFKL